jgi:hypothetical protein
LRRRLATLSAALVLALALTLATATCTQLLGVEAGESVPEGGPLPKCEPGKASCGGQLCDTDIVNDKANCGKCGNACVGSNATAACAEGKCTLACAPNYADCDHNDTTGCEAFLQTDVKNCGACGHDCRGTPCVGGACVPIIMGVAQSQVTYLGMDDDSAYVGTTTGKIEVFPLNGGAKTLAFSDPTSVVTQLTYTAPTIYGLRTLYIAPGGTEIDALSRNGQNARCLMRSPTLRRFDADNAGFVFAGGLPVPDAGANPLIRELPTSASCEVEAGAPRPLGASQENKDKVGEGVILDGPNAFVTALDTGSSSTGLLGRIDRQSGQLFVLNPRIRPLKNLGRGLAVDDKFVYWIDSDVFVRRLPKGGCPTATPCQEDVYFEEFGNVFAVSVDDRAVYVLATDGQVAYLEVLDKNKLSDRRRVPGDISVVSGDVAWNGNFIVWGLGQKVYRLAR